ncbi:unnamed protein product, partial [Brassica oleracea var. botrytis]
ETKKERAPEFYPATIIKPCPTGVIIFIITTGVIIFIITTGAVVMPPS